MTAPLAFQAWPKTPRLFRDAVVTEKIDGTNAAVIIQRAEPREDGLFPFVDNSIKTVHVEDVAYVVGAQSRKRLIWPGQDNMGFAAWVAEHAEALVPILREGVHYGEWWGHGIQRGYGLEQGDKRFSLFNVHRYGKAIPSHPLDPRPRIPGLGVVPVLDQHTFSTERVQQVRDELAANGSQAAPGFMRPEGVIVFHSAAGQVFKSLIENDDTPKGES